MNLIQLDSTRLVFKVGPTQLDLSEANMGPTQLYQHELNSTRFAQHGPDVGST